MTSTANDDYGYNFYSKWRLRLWLLQRITTTANEDYGYDFYRAWWLWLWLPWQMTTTAMTSTLNDNYGYDFYSEWRLRLTANYDYSYDFYREWWLRLWLLQPLLLLLLESTESKQTSLENARQETALSKSPMPMTLTVFKLMEFHILTWAWMHTTQWLKTVITLSSASGHNFWYIYTFNCKSNSLATY